MSKYFLKYKLAEIPEDKWNKSIEYEKGFQSLEEAQKAKRMAEGDCGYMLEYQVVDVDGKVGS